MHSPASARVLRFGAFEADLQARELRRQGMQIKLQDQPFQVLVVLLEHAGEIVTREQLRQKLWPTDTFVDVDNSVNAAVNRLREALGNSAESPRYVETLPRRGYRFVAPVTAVSTSDRGSGFAHAPSGIPQKEQPVPSQTQGIAEPVDGSAVEAAPAKDLSTSRAPAIRNRTTIALAAVLVVLLLGGVALLYLRRAQPPATQYIQLTNYADSASSPAVSPDGRMLAFIRGDNTFYGPGEIYLKLLPDGESFQLTHDGLSKMSPIFSADGTRIAYTTVQRGVWDTWTVPVPGGSPQRMLPNASGLTWIGRQQVMFSELTGGIHMKIVTAARKQG